MENEGEWRWRENDGKILSTPLALLTLISEINIRGAVALQAAYEEIS